MKNVDCEQSLSVPQNQSRKNKNRAAKQRASRSETASQEDCKRALPLDFCVSSTDSEEQKVTLRSLSRMTYM